MTYRVQQWIDSNSYANLNYVLPYYPIIFHCNGIDSDWKRLIKISKDVIDQVILKNIFERLQSYESLNLSRMIIFVLWRKLRAYVVKKIPMLKKIKKYYQSKNLHVNCKN